MMMLLFGSTGRYLTLLGVQREREKLVARSIGEKKRPTALRYVSPRRGGHLHDTPNVRCKPRPNRLRSVVPHGTQWLLIPPTVRSGHCGWREMTLGLWVCYSLLYQKGPVGHLGGIHSLLVCVSSIDDVYYVNQSIPGSLDKLTSSRTRGKTNVTEISTPPHRMQRRQRRHPFQPPCCCCCDWISTSSFKPRC